MSGLDHIVRSRRGNSVIEVIVILVILTSGMVGAYGILQSGQRLATTTEHRIQAINIAREWLEAMSNIRDTNWLKFPSNYGNCWMTKDYDANCIGGGSTTFATGSYTLTKNGNLWYLSGTIVPLSYTGGYRDQFPVYIDANGLLSSTGGSASCGANKSVDCKTIFTREIRLTPNGSDKMKVESIVKWADNSKTTAPYVINLDLTLTNWRKDL